MKKYNVYKTPLLWLGIVMNLFGIAYSLWKTRRQQGHALSIRLKQR